MARLACLIALLAGATLALQMAVRPATGEPSANSSRTSDQAACERAGFRAVLDVGHTMEAPGAKSARGIYEYVFNLVLARRIEQQLLESGFGRTVLLVTDGPAREGLFQRVARANRLSADLLISVHHDSVPDRFLAKWEFEGEERSFSDRFKGHSIFISRNNRDRVGSLQFASQLGNRLRERGLHYTPHYTDRIMGSRQRQLVDPVAGVYRYDQLIVLKDTRMPAALLEAGSIINRGEELRMGSAEHQSRISAAVTDAVEDFCALRRAPAPVDSRAATGSPLRQRSSPTASAR
jgi:N-acetylmuramoyl-L-alanine amidase